MLFLKFLTNNDSNIYKKYFIKNIKSDSTENSLNPILRKFTCKLIIILIIREILKILKNS